MLRVRCTLLRVLKKCREQISASCSPTEHCMWERAHAFWFQMSTYWCWSEFFLRDFYGTFQNCVSHFSSDFLSLFDFRSMMIIPFVLASVIFCLSSWALWWYMDLGILLCPALRLLCKTNLCFCLRLLILAVWWLQGLFCIGVVHANIWSLPL